jgi:hypothetical protein
LGEKFSLSPLKKGFRMKAAVFVFGLLLSLVVTSGTPAQAGEQLPSGCVIIIDNTLQEVMVCPK